MKKIAKHHDVLSVKVAIQFRDNMGGVLALRLEKLKRSLDAFKDARLACVEIEKLIMKNQKTK